MNIVWDWSLQSEARRISEMSRKVSNGFYHLHHFLPLPFDPKNTLPPCSHQVYLPDIPYVQIPRYWESVQKMETSYPLKELKNITDKLIDNLTSLKLAPLTPHPLEGDTKIFFPKVLLWLHTTFPNLPLPDSIIIHPSYFGTGGSFFFNQQLKTVFLYLRSDQNLYCLIEILLTAILRPHAGNTLYADWEKTEYLVDYLLLESSLRQLLPPPESWMPTTTPPHHSQKLIDQSNKFLQKIGLSVNSAHQFNLQGNTILFNHAPISGFTAKEHAILTALISRSPAPLTIDEIGDLIFTKEEKFSLAAINKMIERLRNKLSDLGISSSYLATASGVGYYLKN